MPTVCQLVDSISATPTVGFSFNGGSVTLLAETSMPPPPLRQVFSDSMMSDGATLAASSYGLREFTLVFNVRASDTGTLATTLQPLQRLLDAGASYLMWQPVEAPKPVFFKLYRSQPGNLDWSLAGADIWKVSLPLVAEPFALGLREDIAAVTVTNNPAAGSNGHIIDVTPIGDVATPLVLAHGGSADLVTSFGLFVRQHGTPSDLVFFKQAESMTMGTDTTVSASNDATLSGAGNNYANTTFAGVAAMKVRLSWNVATDSNTAAKQKALAGRYRVVAYVKRSGATSPINLEMSTAAGTTLLGDSVATVLDTTRQAVALGTISFGLSGRATGYATELGVSPDDVLEFGAERVSGADTMRWDCVCLFPIDEASAVVSNIVDPGNSAYTVHDGVSDAHYYATDPITGPEIQSMVGSLINRSGGTPLLLPNQVNRLFLTVSNAPSGGPFNLAPISGAGGQERFLGYYWPRYIHTRPATT